MQTPVLPSEGDIEVSYVRSMFNADLSKLLFGMNALYVALYYYSTTITI